MGVHKILPPALFFMLGSPIKLNMHPHILFHAFACYYLKKQNNVYILQDEIVFGISLTEPSPTLSKIVLARQA